MSTSPIQYTSRTYNTILNDINTDPLLVDKPEWWKRIWAGVGDTFSMYLNAQANNTYLSTAFTRNAVANLCALIDYQMAPQTTANGSVLFEFVNSTSAAAISAAQAELIALTTGTISVSSKRFESRGAVNASYNDTFIVDATFNLLIPSTTRTWTLGEKVKLTTTLTMPAPLISGSFYYAIPDAASLNHSCRLAATLSDAYENNYIDITTTGSGTLTFYMYTIVATVYQQTTKPQYIVGRSDGITPWQEFNLADKDVLKSTEIVVINGVTWTRVDTFVNSISTDTHYKLLYKTDNSSFIQFGDGTYGMIPGAFDVYISYATGGGLNSNVTSQDTVKVYAGTNSAIIRVSNPGILNGGSDPESLDSAKRLAPTLLKARDRFITVDDGEALALSYGGLSKVKINTNTYGPLSCQVVAIATGGGNPTPALQALIQAFLISKTILSSMDVRFVNATITPITFVSAAKILSGYTWGTVTPPYSGVYPLFLLAWYLFLAETGQEILDTYNTSGIASATSAINTMWGLSFTSIDYANIQKLLDNFIPRDFGDHIDISDAPAFIQANIAGIDYMTVTTPSLPLTLASNQITTGIFSPGNLTQL
jgi:hypothetical protein